MRLYDVEVINIQSGQHVNSPCGATPADSEWPSYTGNPNLFKFPDMSRCVFACSLSKASHIDPYAPAAALSFAASKTSELDLRPAPDALFIV
jgi:hypothetical protein